MRMMMQVTIPVEAGNAAARTGAFGRSFQKILESLKPEAAYLGAGASGERGGFIVFDLKDTSQIPSIAEPFFLAYNAKVTFFVSASWVFLRVFRRGCAHFADLATGQRPHYQGY
jgi:hypothetical protein